MKFKLGQKWLTRDETPVTIVDVYIDSRPFPVIGIFDDGNELHEFSLSGKFVLGDEDAPGDLIKLIYDPKHYESQGPYNIQDYVDFLERRYLVRGKIEFPDEVRKVTATLTQAVQYMLDQENIGEYYCDD